MICPGSGSCWMTGPSGNQLSYQEQLEPKGLAEAFILGEPFIGTDNVCLILGDNLFYGHGLSQRFKQAAARGKRCHRLMEIICQDHAPPDDGKRLAPGGG
jgi:dTDP-glucose pyrophosphorylase